MLTFPERKQIRAKVIAAYVREAGYRGVVAFSCGNAAAALRDEGLVVVEVGPMGGLRPGKWWRPAEVHQCWPDLFDATSGHLPIPLMLDIAWAFRKHLGDLPGGGYEVPTGSGETIVCLRWAYPAISFTPIYGMGAGAKYEVEAPLNQIVADGDPRLLAT